MTPTNVISYRERGRGKKEGELRIGWASWDKRAYKDRSIKWAYLDKSGKISRGGPEIPFDILLDMLKYAADQGELDNDPELKSLHEKLGERLNSVEEPAPDELTEQQRREVGA